MGVVMRLAPGLALLSLGLGLALSTASAAPRGQLVDWELLPGPGTPIIRVWALADGTLFAADSGRVLYSSSDLGDNWQTIPLPAGGWGIAPDPTNAATVYAVAAAGLYKSTDTGATWTLIRGSVTPISDINFRNVVLAVSPADPNVLYAVEPLDSFNPSSIIRSTDGGSTWTKAIDISRAGSPCVTLVSVLTPHSSDRLRVFSDQGCYAGRNLGTRLQQSIDQGSTWSTVFPDGRGLYAGTIIGGSGADPIRFYQTTSAFQGTGPARLYRSDNDASSWSLVLEAGDPRSLRFGGVVYDPDQPDTVFVATGQTPSPDDTGVRVTYDGGQTWDFLGSQDIGWVNDLARTLDGTLVAATNEGMWRLIANAGP